MAQASKLCGGHTVWQAAPHTQASKQAVWGVASCATLGGHITLLQVNQQGLLPAYLHSRQLYVRSSLKQSGVETEKKLKIRRELEMFGQARRR